MKNNNEMEFYVLCLSRDTNQSGKNQKWYDDLLKHIQRCHKINSVALYIYKIMVNSFYNLQMRTFV